MNPNSLLQLNTLAYTCENHMSNGNIKTFIVNRRCSLFAFQMVYCNSINLKMRDALTFYIRSRIILWCLFTDLSAGARKQNITMSEETIEYFDISLTDVKLIYIYTARFKLWSKIKIKLILYFTGVDGKVRNTSG